MPAPVVGAGSTGSRSGTIEPVEQYMFTHSTHLKVQISY